MPAWKKDANLLVSTVSSLKESIDKDIPHVLLDVRPADAAHHEHIQGAVSIPLKELAGAKDKFPANKKAPIVIYSNSKELSEEAFKTVRKWGYANTTYLQGGIEAWKAAGNPVASRSLKTAIVYVPKPAPGEITIEEFKRIVEKSPADKFVLDARDKDEAAEGILKIARNIPAQDVTARLQELPKDKEIIIHCSTGTRAEIAYTQLKEAGLKARFLNAEVEVSKDGSYKVTKE